MDYIKVQSEKANKAKTLIIRLKLFDTSRKVLHSRSYVFFPVLVMNAKHIKPFDKIGATLISKKELEIAKDTYQNKINKLLGKEGIVELAKGYDQLGETAIIDFKGKRSKEKEIATVLIKSNNSIKTVLAKAGAVSGKYRVRKVRYVAGIKTFIVNYKENNCIFRFDIRKVFFSNRLSFERSRIINLVKDGENVMVMFAGVGPFAIEIAKLRRKSKVIGIEENKFGYKSMIDNIKLNKIGNVNAVLGDVKKVSKNFKGFADRIIMPLPWSSLSFLDDVYMIAKKSTIVHIYAFTKAENAFEEIFKKIKEHAKKKKYEVILLNKRVVRPYSKAELEVVLDYRMKK